MRTERALIGRRYEDAQVLVTGGSGFIGAHLCERLASYGARVTALARHAPASVPAGVEFVSGDIADEPAVASLLSRRFRYVFNLAAYSGQVPSFTDHDQSLKTNCLGQLNLLEGIRTRSPETALCFASSRLVYGRTQYLPVDEAHPLEPRSFYGIQKRTCEEYARYYGMRYGVSATSLRLSNPYGPHDPAPHHRYNIANWMIDEVVAGREVTVFGRGEQLRDYLYIEDAVDALLLAAADDRSAGGVYNAGSGDGTQLMAFVRAAIVASGSGSVRCEDWPEEYLLVETGDFAADIAKIGGELGWRPRVSLAEGLAATVAAQRRHIAAGATRREAA